jgi:hypothetical protein
MEPASWSVGEAWRQLERPLHDDRYRAAGKVTTGRLEPVTGK